jgi:hypothetical protein
MPRNKFGDILNLFKQRCNALTAMHGVNYFPHYLVTPSIGKSGSLSAVLTLF